MIADSDLRDGWATLPPTMPGVRRPTIILGLALGLAFGLASTGACTKQASEPAVPANPAAQTDDSARASSTVATVTDGEIEPDPEQLAAGVPYLRFHIEVGDSPVRGPADAPVTIVMFSDFECKFCDEAFNTITELQHEYGDDIRFVYKALPLDRHPNALAAALVGHSAKAQGKFWEFHDLVFSGRGIDPETIAAYENQIGLDVARVDRELESLTYAPALREDLRVAKRLRLTSTPVFFINGRMLAGARPKHIFRHYVDQELELAARLAEQGVSTAGVYDYTTQWGYTAIVYEDEPASLDDDTVYPVPIGDAPARGAADAPITIVAFSDFQCPFCARGHDTMEQLRAIYGDRIRFVFKHFPLPGHPLGALASRASYAALDVGKFWEFHDAIFTYRGRYDASDVIDELVKLGVSPERAEAAITSDAHDAQIEADLELGARLRIDGTPAYFINGRPIVGALPLLDFRMLIVEELARVEQAKQQGVPAAKVYEHLTGSK
jgi:protein-disulfide isomerase